METGEFENVIESEKVFYGFCQTNFVFSCNSENTVALIRKSDAYYTLWFTIFIGQNEGIFENESFIFFDSNIFSYYTKIFVIMCLVINLRD